LWLRRRDQRRAGHCIREGSGRGLRERRRARRLGAYGRSGGALGRRDRLHRTHDRIARRLDPARGRHLDAKRGRRRGHRGRREHGRRNWRTGVAGERREQLRLPPNLPLPLLLSRIHR
ncbi:hypothetical protein ACHAWF_018128, partial [Thalassiosira exigua]